MRCPACTEEIPADSRFCGLCGFRLTPIPAETYRERAKATPPLLPDEPIPLTRRKPPSSEVRSGPTQPRLQLVPSEPVRLDRPKRGVVQLDTPGAPLGYQATVPESQAPRLPTVPPLPLAAVAQTVTPVTPVAPRPPVPVAVPGETVTPRPRTQTDSNNRRHQRFPLKVEVSYTSDHNFFTGFVQNIGEGGLFVATHMPARLGDVIEVSFSVPGLPRVCTAVCKVRWIREYNASSPDTVPGMGLQFAQIESDARAAIDLFIGHREPIFYDD